MVQQKIVPFGQILVVLVDKGFSPLAQGSFRGAPGLFKHIVLIFLFQRKLLDASLGFAGGVMLAASYW